MKRHDPVRRGRDNGVRSGAGQAPRRTPWGDPDLQGLWTNATITPFERPADMVGKPVLTEQEAAEFEKQTHQARDADNRAGGTDADLGRAYNQFWYDRGTKVVGTRRTSLVVDPPDGRVPSLTPEAQQRADARPPRASAALPTVRKIEVSPSAASCGRPQVRR